MLWNDTLFVIAYRFNWSNITRNSLQFIWAFEGYLLSQGKERSIRIIGSNFIGTHRWPMYISRHYEKANEFSVLSYQQQVAKTLSTFQLRKTMTTPDWTIATTQREVAQLMALSIPVSGRSAREDIPISGHCNDVKEKLVGAPCTSLQSMGREVDSATPFCDPANASLSSDYLMSIGFKTINLVGNDFMCVNHLCNLVRAPAFVLWVGSGGFCYLECCFLWNHANLRPEDD